jgi:restriction endonuclease S subunit
VRISILQLREEYDPYFTAYFLRSRLGQIQFEKWFTGSSGQIEVKPEDLNQFVLPQASNEGISREKQQEIISQARELEKAKHSVDRELEGLNRTIGNFCLKKLGIEESTVPRFSLGSKHSAAWITDVEDRFDFVWNHSSSVAVRDLLTKNGAVSLSELLEGEFEYGINASGKEVGELPFINVENLNLDGAIHSDGIRYADDAPDSKKVRTGDLLISRSRTVGKASYVSEREEGFTFGSYILRFRVNATRVDPLYVVNFINSSLGQAEVTFLQSGSRSVEEGGGNNINPNELKQLQLILPKSEEERNAFRNQLMDMFAQREKKKLQLAEQDASVASFLKNLLL